MDIDAVTFAKALADDTRQEIMKHLCCVWLSVNDVVEKLGGKVNQPTVSFHLKKLEEANLVEVRQVGRQRFYMLNQEQLTVCCGTLVWSFAPNYSDRLYIAPLLEEPAERESSEEPIYIEGIKIQVTHFQIERNPKLRQMFLNSLAKPILCDICHLNTGEAYPWTHNLIEVHHLLPLSSAIALQHQNTKLQDLVAICPNCHKAVHQFYAQWLEMRAQNDFLSAEEAHEAYRESKSIITERLKMNL